MNTSWRTMTIAYVALILLIAAPLAMAQNNQQNKQKDKQQNKQKESQSAAKESKAANVEKNKEKEKQVKRTSYLGVVVEPLHPSFWAHMKDVLEHKQGVLIARVAKDSPAEKAGLKTNDILMTYGDQKLYSPDQLVKLVQSDKAGQKVELKIVREGKTQEINVTLGESEMRTAEHAGRRIMRRTPQGLASQTPSDPSDQNPSDRNPSDQNPSDQNKARWESFDSLTLKSLGDNRYKVDIGYKTKEGKIEHSTFQGTREEIQHDIMLQKDLPANEREHLLRSLDLSERGFEFEFPRVYYTPDGRLIWEFPNFGREFPRMTGNEF